MNKVPAMGGLVHKHAPDLEELTKDVLFGTVWQDERLSKRDRSLVTMAILIVQKAEGPLAGHMLRAQGHGVTVDEIRALVTHCVMYAGWGAGESAVRVMENIQLGAYEHDNHCTKICCPEDQAGTD